MSFKNPFLQLGNDVEDSEILITQENIKTNTKNHKKEDVHPRSDISKATGKKSNKLEANNNRAISPVQGQRSQGKGSAKERQDKHSKSGKTDSNKKIRQGWGDAKTEIDAELDVEAERIQSSEAEEPKIPTITMEDYLSAKQNTIVSRRSNKAAPIPVSKVEAKELKGKKSLFNAEVKEVPEKKKSAEPSGPVFQINYVKEEPKKRSQSNKGKRSPRGQPKPAAKSSAPLPTL
ncbi:uncharacterized protein HGUI_04044 [Hanseniaspora guilliermondii]|uniref:Hyaluronan/mRNA-binding protein domain-containing protein n=1 Tax=Hanseniaspora guilliermondii TaxID=56406 RepID=A0A1L0B9L3_9ASCO|nr:uncharacterized protein HGUI_04044 [Hanseniaspora guilliermondii]